MCYATQPFMFWIRKRVIPVLWHAIHNVRLLLFNYFLKHPQLQILSIASDFQGQSFKASPMTIACKMAKLFRFFTDQHNVDVL